MSEKQIGLSIIIPCYNEEENISFILQELCRAVDNYKSESITELVLVDNGSLDNTRKIIADINCSDSGVRLKKVFIDENKGYGYGIMAGLKAASGSVLAFTHADLQVGLNEVFVAYKTYLSLLKTENKILIKGVRSGRSLDEGFFSFAMQALASAILCMRLSEINAQPKVFGRELLGLLTEPPNDFSFDLYLLAIAKKAGFTVYDMPVRFKRRKYGRSKGCSGSDFKTKIKVIKNTLKYFFMLRKILNNKFSLNYQDNP